MPGATCTIEIDAPRSVVYSVITDYEKYPQFLADVAAVRVVDPGARIIEQTLKLIKQVSYQIRMVETPDSEVRWSLHEGGRLLKENNGHWQLEELPGERTRATYTLEVVVGGFVPGRVVDKLTGKTLPATLQAFKARAESLK